MNEGDVATLLKHAVPDPGPEDFADLATIVRRGRRRRARRIALRTMGGVLAISFVVVAGGLSVARLHDSLGHSRAEAVPSSHFTPLPPPRSSDGGVIPGPGRPLIELFDPSQDLLPGGHSVSVSEVARLVPYQLYLPADAALPEPEVWVVRYIAEDGTPSYDAAVRYDSSVVNTFSTWTNGRDPVTEYKKAQSEWNVGYVTTINGNPAWIVPAGSAHTVDPRISSVKVSIGDVEMTFLGRVPVDDLIQYASTLRPA